MQEARPTEVLRYAAFTDHGEGGNPAGVVLDARDLDEQQMQAIAAEVGYSETAFLVSTATVGRFATRYFSALAEVPFCGHATVASAVALVERGMPDPLVFETKVADVVVTVDHNPDGIMATLESTPTRSKEADPAVVGEALRALRWDEDALDPRYPPHVGFAGNEHLLLGLDSRERLAALDYDYGQLDRLMRREGWTTVHLFWAESSTVFYARDPFPPGGVVEDPATGAAAAAFGGYLRDLGLAPTPSQVTLFQGQDMGRPSRLLVGIDERTDSVRVSGAAASIAEALTWG